MDRAAMRSDGNNFRQLALRRKVAGDIGIVGLWIMWDYEIMGLWNWVETFSISEFRYGAFSQLHNLTINLACRVRL